MKVYKIKAKNYIDNIYEVSDDSSYIIQKIKDEFTIWDDPYGDYEGGEDPIYSDLNYDSGNDHFNSLDDVKAILSNGDYIDSESEFIDIEW